MAQRQDLPHQAVCASSNCRQILIPHRNFPHCSIQLCPIKTIGKCVLHLQLTKHQENKNKRYHSRRKRSTRSAIHLEKMRSVVTNRVFLVTESLLAWGCGVRRKKALQYAGNAAWVISNMVDEVEESGETEENVSQSGCRQFKTPMELFQDKKTVRVCAPMVRYSK